MFLGTLSVWSFSFDNSIAHHLKSNRFKYSEIAGDTVNLHISWLSVAVRDQVQAHSNWTCCGSFGCSTPLVAIEESTKVTDTPLLARGDSLDMRYSFEVFVDNSQTVLY